VFSEHSDFSLKNILTTTTMQRGAEHHARRGSCKRAQRRRNAAAQLVALQLEITASPRETPASIVAGERMPRRRTTGNIR
jgi:hypothetical protein